jgi:hypothetical protein
VEFLRNSLFEMLKIKEILRGGGGGGEKKFLKKKK